MKRRIGLPLFVGLALLSVGQASAQYAPYYRPGPQKGPGPAVSPYLNLLRGNNTAVNYYLGVQPLIEQRAMQQQILLGDDRRNLPQDLGPEELFPKLAGTGHPAQFFNYGGYYNLGVNQQQQQQVVPRAPGRRR